MDVDQTELVVLGLNRAEALDLRRSDQGLAGVRLEEPDADGAAVGALDQATLVVLTLSSISVQGLVAWLMKNRHGEVIEQEVELRGADGSMERRTLKIRRNSSTAAAETAAILDSIRLPDVDV